MLCEISGDMIEARTFQHRGIVEGFFRPRRWIAHRQWLFEFGAARGMNYYPSTRITAKPRLTPCGCFLYRFP